MVSIAISSHSVTLNIIGLVQIHTSIITKSIKELFSKLSRMANIATEMSVGREGVATILFNEINGNSGTTVSF